MTTADTSIPRIALFITAPLILSETEQILRNKYSSLLLITEKAKLKEFDVPLIIVVDRMKDVLDIRAQHPVEGTRVLVIVQDGDSEVMSAAFEAGADDYITHPFTPEAFIEKTEKYLEAFRQTA